MHKKFAQSCSNVCVCSEYLSAYKQNTIQMTNLNSPALYSIRQQQLPKFLFTSHINKYKTIVSHRKVFDRWQQQRIVKSISNCVCSRHAPLCSQGEQERNWVYLAESAHLKRSCLRFVVIVVVVVVADNSTPHIYQTNWYPYGTPTNKQ